ncbi:MAG: SLC13 family permease [Casimicrobiaceae bacterium]
MNPELIDVIAISGLGGHGVALLAFTVLVFGLFIWDRWPIATVCLGVLVALPLLFLLFPFETPDGRVSPFQFFSGFGHQALIAISALMILGHGLVVTGALEPTARRLSALLGTRPRLALLAVLVSVAAASGVVNDTPVVVIMIPLILGAVRRAEPSPATMLMPMNFAVLIGGMATTIGTSTNLIVVSMAADMGAARFSMFEFYPLVAIAAVPALLYLWLVAPRMLRSVPASSEAYASEIFDAELRVEKGSWAEGKELEEARKKTENGMRVLEVVTAGGDHLGMSTNRPLQEGDVIRVRDTVENLKEFEAVLQASLHGLDAEATPEAKPSEGKSDMTADASKPAADDPADGGEPRAQEDPELHEVVAQLVVTPESLLAGRSVRQLQLATHYNVIVVGVRQARTDARWHRQNLADRRLAEGDVLLIQGKPRAVRDVQNERLGLLLDSRYVLPRQQKAWTALLTVMVVVVLAATKLVPIALAALGGALVLLISRSLTWRDIGVALSAKVVMLIAASLALGQALTLTGGTAYLASLLVSAAGALAPSMMLALLMGLMGAITNFVSNNAAAAIGTPLAVDIARQLGLPPEPFILAVLFGCNLCYLTPMGYQTNLLVMNAAGYRFGDFLRVGVPLFALMWGVLSLLLIRQYAL